MSDVLPAILFALAAARPFHLVLQATPAAPFPFLSKFGNVTIHVYPHGVLAETLLMRAFSRNGTKTMTVENPMNRTYSDTALSEISTSLHSMSGSLAGLEASAPDAIQVSKGQVKGIEARRFRLIFGTSFADVWMTSAFGDAPQFRSMIDEFVRGISPPTAAALRSLPGIPIYVELNFRRFKKVPILRLERVAYDDKTEDDALRVSSFMFRAPFSGAEQ